MSTDHGGTVELNAQRFDALLAAARDKWSSVGVRVESYIGGTPPQEVLGALDQCEKRASDWKQRGRRLALGKPRTLADGHVDDWHLYNELGATLMSEVEYDGAIARETDLFEIIDDTIVKTSTDVEKLAEQAIVETAGVTTKALTPWVPWLVAAAVLVFLGPALVALVVDGLRSLFSRSES